MATKVVAPQSSSGVTAPDEGCSVRVIHVEHVTEIQRHVLQGADALSIANLFSVLSDPTRVQVVHALLCAPTDELCVCDLASGLGRDDSTISHQLRVLRQQKIVSMRKAGRVVYYRLVDEHIRQLLRMSIDHVREQQAWEV